MLKPLPEKPIGLGFVVTDIENKPDGSVIAIDTCWRDELDIHHVTHNNWGDYWSWLYKISVKHEKFRTIYAHNGGGWDWLSLVEYLLSDEGKGKTRNLSAVCAGTSMVMLRCNIEKKLTITFCDSLQLLRSSLDKLSKSILGKNKVDMPYETHLKMYEENPDLFREYHRLDTELLIEILEKSLKIIRENVAKIETFGYTIGSTAMKVFRTMGLDREILIPTDPKLKNLLREGYKGGRVEVLNSGYFDNIFVYDINSLYPSIMLSKEVPVSDRGEWVSEFQPEKIGVYSGKFEQRKTDIPPVLLLYGKGEYKTQGVYYSPELELLRSVDPSCVFEIDEGFIFSDTEILFKNYVEKLYGLRLKNKDGALSLLCKYLLNTLYGKFGQKPEREQIVKVDNWLDLCTMVDENAKISPMDIENGIYKVISESVCNHEHVGIAGIITSHSRCSLYNGLLCSWPNVAYCDTDSLHIFNNRLTDTLVSEKIGAYKLEFEGEGVYAGKKLYSLRNKTTEKTRAKGVSIGGNNGCSFSFDDMLLIAEQKMESIKCTFKKPATPKQVFVGKKPCTFSDRTRTLKRTV